MQFIHSIPKCNNPKGLNSEIHFKIQHVIHPELAPVHHHYERTEGEVERQEDAESIPRRQRRIRRAPRQLDINPKSTTL